MAEYSFDEFVNEVKEHIKEYLPASYEESAVEIKTVSKNNETLHGLLVASPDSTVIPNIYLEYYYEQYQGGERMENIMQDIAKVRVANENSIDFDLARFKDYDSIKEQIIPRLIGKENNEAFLADHPYTEVADLAVVYAVRLEPSEEGYMSVPITQGLLEMWNVTVEDVHAQSVENMETTNRPTFRSMFDTLSDFMPSEFLQDEMPATDAVKEGMFVLSNKDANFGAAAILDDKFMEQVSLRLGPDFWILPSSVHELILIPNSDDTMDLAGLEAMVKDVNDTQLAAQDLLSYHVYHYDAETKELYRADSKDAHEKEKAAKLEAGKEEKPRESLRGKLDDKKAEVSDPAKKAPSKVKHKDAASL